MKTNGELIKAIDKMCLNNKWIKHKELKLKEDMKKLISMTDFVLSQQIIGMEVQSLVHQYQERARRFYLIQRYAEFLKQPLTLGMFVPCDEDGNVLEEPFYDPSNPQYYECLLHQYQQAKERVLFDGFFLTKLSGYVRNKQPHVFSFKQIQNSTVEGLLTSYKEEFRIPLTHSALKQIGL